MRFFVLISLIIILGVMGSIPYAEAFTKQAKLTVVVVDENGYPMDGADAGIGFERNMGGGAKMFGQRGITGLDGRFSASGNCNGHVGYGANKQGYYRTHHVFNFKEYGPFGWKPWNAEFRVVMRKIENPVPMYARDSKFSKLEIPVIGENVGFDLTRFDWVAPYGTGVHADFIFKLEKRVTDRKDFEASLEVTFSNPDDGILLVKEDRQYGSEFKLPRFAPVVGYNTKLILAEGRSPGESIVRNFEFNKEHNNYIFRVRSEEKDEIVNAIYGKIHGPFSFDPIFSRTATITIKYYLNPDYTRNLEYDPKQNLFGPLPSLQQVGIQ